MKTVDTLPARSSLPARGGSRAAGLGRTREPRPVSRRIRRILVPIDFSADSQHALQYALDVGAQLGATVTPVHVLERIPYQGEWLSPPNLSDFTPSTQHLMTELRKLIAGSKFAAEPVVRVGHAAEEIVAAARDQGTDLIILSTHGYTGMRHVLLGSVAEKVLHHATCPVLAVRMPE
jgi:nucleotide-binding universal stress UspA family protein